MNTWLRYTLISLLIILFLLLIYVTHSNDFSTHSNTINLCSGAKISVNNIEGNPDYCLVEGKESIFRVVLINDGTENFSSLKLIAVSDDGAVYAEVLNDSINFGEKKEINISFDVDKLRSVRIVPIIKNDSENILCVEHVIELINVPLCNITEN